MPQESANLKLKLYNAITDAKESAISWFNDIFNYSNSNWVKIDNAYGEINSSYIKDLKPSGDKIIITKGDGATSEIDGAVTKPASKTNLGIVQIGDNIFVDTAGVISLKKDDVDGALGYEAAEKMNLVPVTIPSTGWSTDSNTSYASYIDITATGIKSTDCVALVISPDSNLVAQKCFFAATEALTDKIRIRVRNVPTETIQAFYYIIREDILMGFGQTPIGGAILPPAASNQIGAVMPGKGLSVEASGVLNLDFDKIYPVGSIYQSTSSTDPAELFGGTWEQIESKFLIGASDEYPAGSTGGDKNVTLSQENIPKYVIEYSIMCDPGVTGRFGSPIYDYYQYATAIKTNIWSGGSDAPFSILNPYYSVYVWKRIE